MAHFYFPILGVLPADKDVDISCGDMSIIPRRWRVSTFDLATLSTRHRLYISYQLMDVFLRACHCELRISTTDEDSATSLADTFRAMLYLNGVRPFVMPFFTNYSCNDYAGINSRDSSLLSEKLPEGLRNGITSETATVIATPYDKALQIIRRGEDSITGSTLIQAEADLRSWQGLSAAHKALAVVQGVLQAAPMITHWPQSLLHIWTGIEALFPDVTQEVSFRIALYLAQLNQSDANKMDYFRIAKKAYDLRSKVAHGVKQQVTVEEWQVAWHILVSSCRAVINRGNLPKETALLEELLTGQSIHTV